MGKIRISGKPKVSNEELLKTSKLLIAEHIRDVMEIMYGIAIMEVAPLDELNDYMLECIVDNKSKYKDMTKGEFYEMVKQMYERL